MIQVKQRPLITNEDGRWEVDDYPKDLLTTTIELQPQYGSIQRYCNDFPIRDPNLYYSTLANLFKIEDVLNKQAVFVFKLR